MPVFEQHLIVMPRGVGTFLDLFYSAPGIAVDQKEPARIVEKRSWDGVPGGARILDQTAPLIAELYPRVETPGIQTGEG